MEMININNTTSHEMQIVTSRIMEYLRMGERKIQPELIIVTGAIGSGKTTYIKKELINNYVWIDSGRFYRSCKS
jgi:HrpA-like RNA helicase